MIIDKASIFSDKQSLAVAAGTTVSTYAKDLTGLQAGEGQRLDVVAVVGTAFAGGTSMQVAIQTSPDDTTYTTVQDTKVFTDAELVAGKEIRIGLTFPIAAASKYMRVAYITLGTHTGGTITTFLTPA